MNVTECCEAGQDGELPDLYDCVPIVCQGVACTNYECIYTNVTQGTPCDDGQYCTATDECDGNGICVGSGTPCGGGRFPQCCEFTDSCICATCDCLPEAQMTSSRIAALRGLGREPRRAVACARGLRHVRTPGRCVARQSAKSALKTGTGTSPRTLFGGLIEHELGAGPLFQPPFPAEGGWTDGHVEPIVISGLVAAPEGVAQ